MHKLRKILTLILGSTIVLAKVISCHSSKRMTQESTTETQWIRDSIAALACNSRAVLLYQRKYFFKDTSCKDSILTYLRCASDLSPNDVFFYENRVKISIGVKEYKLAQKVISSGVSDKLYYKVYDAFCDYKLNNNIYLTKMCELYAMHTKLSEKSEQTDWAMVIIAASYCKSLDESINLIERHDDIFPSDKWGMEAFQLDSENKILPW